MSQQGREVLLTLADLNTNRPQITNDLRGNGLRVYAGSGGVGEIALCHRCGYSIAIDWSNEEFGRHRHDCRPDRLKLPAQAGKRKGYVYLIRCRELVKIGQTYDPTQRIPAIHQNIPWPVEILGVIESGNYIGLESRLHALFKEKRFKGEWFALDDADIDFIRSKYEVKPLAVSE